MYSYSQADLFSFSKADGNLFALIDGAIDPVSLKRLASSLNASNHVRLFAGTFASGAEAFSPVLIDVEQALPSREKFLDRLIRACEGKPALSFLRAPTSLQQLGEHLRQLLTIKTSDNQEFLLRYADVRMLPAVFGVLSAEQRRAFLGPVGNWTAVDHLDQLTEMAEPGKNDRTLEYPLQLDDTQFARLMDDTVVYSIVSQLEQSFEQFSQEFNLGDRIEFVARNTKRASAHGFNDSADVTAWCMGALMGGENFHSSRLVAEAIGYASRENSKLFNTLADITEEGWQAIRSSVKDSSV
jgi:hypothetical protein